MPLDGALLDRVLAKCEELNGRLDKGEARLDAMLAPTPPGPPDRFHGNLAPPAEIPARGEYADAQARCDAVADALGANNGAPRPRQGEPLLAYRARLAADFQQHSRTWNGIELHRLPADVLAVAERAIYADSVKAAGTVGRGRELRTRDPVTGQTVITFQGDRSFIRDLVAPMRRMVTGFDDDPWCESKKGN